MTSTAVTAKSLSHVGCARDDNQDTTRAHLPDDPLIGETHGSVLAIADGMGGYANGSLASTTAIETFFSAFYHDQPKARLPSLRSAVQQANLAVHQAAFRLNAGQMGTTLTVANIVGDRLYLAHVGDTRAYLVRGGKARCLTSDHSVVGELVRMRVISPDKVRSHQQRSVLNRSLGLSLFVQPDVSQVVLEPGDTLILCSDGLWALVEDDEFADLATRNPDPGDLTRQLVELALQRQTDDNASVVAARVERIGSQAPMAQKSASGWRRVASVFDWLF